MTPTEDLEILVQNLRTTGAWFKGPYAVPPPGYTQSSAPFEAADIVMYQHALIVQLEKSIVEGVESRQRERFAVTADFQEFIYRCVSQVPFEHGQWANEKGAALLAELKKI